MAAIRGDSNSDGAPAVLGVATGQGGAGVAAGSDNYEAVHAETKNKEGFAAVTGFALNSEGHGAGVYGESKGKGSGVAAVSQNFHAVFALSHSAKNAGVFGANDAAGGSGVAGDNQSGDGVVGTGRRGVVGHSETFQGIYGSSGANSGVVGESASMHAVFGITHSTFAGVYGTSDAGGTGVCGESPTGVGVLGKGGKLAARFEGDVEVTGDVRLTNADCAEDFDIANADLVEAGTVMVLGDDGALQPSESEYDKRVAGVVSGAGNYKPGIVLDKQKAQPNRRPVALLGKVFCKVDASFAPVEIGDLLTTSSTPGHAMKTIDQSKAFGAVIGKALRPLSGGQGLVPILVALQ
jgi:hypothetical protein